MPKNKLSIVIPCYNCQDTLEESVESIFADSIEVPFDVIMVNDGSTDGSKMLMESIATKYPDIKIITHEENRGGGAARNTGVNNSEGGLIFCLDSDNILDSRSLNRMVHFLLENKVDGVAFHERRFFHSQNRNEYTSHFNTILDRSITIDNIFDKSGMLMDNFLYTKESFLRTLQYPENHGFDTQSFEMRYLSVGNIVKVCPGTFFYHRQNHNEPSYFEREFNKGNFSINYYLAIEDIWEMFSLAAKKEILGYDIFKNSSLRNNILSFLQNLHLEKRLFVSQNAQISNNYELYDDFIINYKQKEYGRAFEVCKKILDTKANYKLLYFALLRSAIGLSSVESSRIEQKVINLLQGLTAEPRVLNKWYHRNLFLFKGVKLILKVWKK